MHQGEKDKELVQRVLNGDRDAYREIMRTHNLMLRSYLSGQLHRLDEVDDLAQEVFITALQKLDSFDTDRDFGIWLRGIARGKLSNHFRSIRRRGVAMEKFLLEVHETIDPQLEAKAKDDTRYAIEALLRCVERLPDKLKKVVRGGLKGRRAEQMATELETSRGAIYNLHYRANQLLRECVDKELADPAK